MLRIGCVKYLNARPLIRGWAGNVEFDHPSALCHRLARGKLDVALVSSFEFLRNPIYRIVDEVSISSDGPVYSVVVAYRGDISEIDEIELDPASETSVNLLRCLIGELDLKARMTRNMDLQSSRPVTDKRPAFRTAHRAQLLIGDQAIRFRQTQTDQFQFWDLGEQWKQLTGLPFVYALWLIRPEVSDAKSVAQRLRTLRDENLADLSGIVADVADNKHAITQEFLDRYYLDYLRFGFGTGEKRGLRIFADLCAKHGLLPRQAYEFDLV